MDTIVIYIKDSNFKIEKPKHLSIIFDLSINGKKHQRFLR